jgi:polysaccharide deacetylase 2 family uncharacterized protein YibQ
MMRLWCWLFAACVAAPPPAAPPLTAPPLAAPNPPAAVAEAPAPGRTGDVDDMAAAESAAREHAAAAAAPAAPRLALATPPAVADLPKASPEPAGPPAWRRFAGPAEPASGRLTISIVLDDMGLPSSQSARAVALPGAVTLAWVPYAPHLADQVAAATARGHEAVLQVPMEALGRADPGPDALRTWLPPATNLAELRAALALVPTAVALDPREGGVALLSVQLMDLLMGELRARRMAFLDDPALPLGVALDRAEAAGVPAVVRDLVIDNDPNPAAIRARLADGEAAAQRRGHAILIGHARQATLDVLEQYLPTLGARGFVLWPVSATIVAQTQIQVSADAVPATGRDTGTAALGRAVAPPRQSGAE